MRVRTNHVPKLEPVFTDDDLDALRERNDARIEAAKKALGPRWVGWLPKHDKPANVAPINQQRNRR